MKQLLCLIALFSIVSNYPYAFVFGSKSEINDPGVNIFVYWPGNGVAARHVHVKPGNHGRGAEWSSQAIQDQSKNKVKKGDKMPFIISKGLYGELDARGHLYKGEISSDGLFGFIVKKQGDKYIVIPDQEAKQEYVSAK